MASDHLASGDPVSHNAVSHKPAFFLFPTSTLSRAETQTLALLLPGLRVLQALHPPVFQPWAADCITAWPAVNDETLQDEIRGRWREFQDFAAIHGEKELLESVFRQWFAGENDEDRLSIQESLRGKEKEKAGKDTLSAKSLLVEGALFLEMARDLDEKARELQDSLTRVDDLEKEFRTILGLTDGDTLDEVPDALSLPLSPAEDIPYRLSQRMACWLRLFGAADVPEVPVLVTSQKEVLGELAEVAREHRNNPESEANLPLPLWAFSDLGKLPAENFAALMEDPGVAAAAAAWREALESVTKALEDDGLMETCWMRGAALQQAFHDAAEGRFDLPGEKIGLSITVLRGCSLLDLWRAVDKAAGHFPPQERFQPSSTMILCLTALP